MKIQLSKDLPSKDGLYLVKFSECGQLHLVQIKTESNQKRIIVPDICPFRGLKNKYSVQCIEGGSNLYFNEFPLNSYWNGPIEIEI